MNGIIIELLLGLYFIGTALPAAVTREQANRRLEVLVYGIILVALAVLGVDLTGLVRR